MNTEQELIERAQLGDREAFCQLARQYQRRIYALALHFTRDPHNAEDLSQEVWLKAYRAIGSFRGESGVYTWLRQIAVNTLLNQQRGQIFEFFGERKKTEAVPWEEVESQLQFEPNYHQRLLVDQVMQALAELAPRERLIFLLKHREGMTYDEIAEACQVSVGTIKKALFRTVTKLREQLDAVPEKKGFSQLVMREEG